MLRREFMEKNEMELKIEELEAKIQKMDKIVTRSQDILDIMNLKNRYIHWMETNNGHRVWPELWCHDDPRLRVEICDGGVYEGPESVRRYYETMGKGNISFQGQLTPKRGVLNNMFVASPCIVVSKDGKTAKGLWHLFGPHAFHCTPPPGDQEKLTAYWHFAKYNDEYIKVDGKWKYLSVHVLQIFRTPYDKSWLEVQNVRRTPDRPEAPPDKPPSSMFSFYNPDATNNNKWMPAPPEEINYDD